MIISRRGSALIPVSPAASLSNLVSLGVQNSLTGVWLIKSQVS